jgi:hypothetical protein
VDGTEWQVHTDATSTFARIGHPIPSPHVDVLSGLHERFGAEAFGVGRASLLIDLDAMFGADPDGGSSYLYVDLRPAPGGALVTGELRY